MDSDYELVPEKCDWPNSVWHYFWRKKSGGLALAKCQFKDCGHKIVKTNDSSTKGCRSHLKAIHGIDLATVASFSSSSVKKTREETSAKTVEDKEVDSDPIQEETEAKMSLRSSSRIQKPRLSETGSVIGGGGGSNVEIVLEDKVIQLEETLKKFRAEVDMKMSIVEQILTTRNEMFTVHKKLIEREQALHESVLSHWKNIPDLAATGLSLKFSDNEHNDVDVDIMYNEEPDVNSSISVKKRQGSSSAHARRDRRKRLKSKIRDESDSDSDDDKRQDQDPLTTVGEPGNAEAGETVAGQDLGNDTDDDDSNSNMERKIFVNYYSEEPGKPGQLVTRTPIWKHYLREENGDSALCKLCDEVGVQTILKVKRGHGTSTLHKHLKFRHPEVVAAVSKKVEPGSGEKPPDTDTSEMESSDGIVRRKSYTTAFKLQVCDRAEESSNRIASQEFDVHERSIRDWIKNKPALLKMEKGRRTLRGGTRKWPELERELRQWVIDQRALNVNTTMATVKLQGNVIARRENLHDFTASNGWYTRFMEREGLSVKEVDQAIKEEKSC